jgi:DNA-directed RNA polymerase subunit RPC12/RpoP
MNAILSSKGVTAGMEFVCSECGEVTTGQEVIDGAYVYIVRKNLDDLHRSIFRCANCMDDFEESQLD